MIDYFIGFWVLVVMCGNWYRIINKLRVCTEFSTIIGAVIGGIAFNVLLVYSVFFYRMFEL